jgi:spermidine/putrescine transport system permease protein
MAWFIWRQKGSRRYFLLLLAVVPLFMSYIVKLYTLRSMLGLNGLISQILLAIGIIEKPSQIFFLKQRAVLITMAVIYMPFVILPIFLALERIPRSLLQASLDLGASGWDTFRRVVLPLSLPGTIAGALFTFVLALGDFITPQMVGGTTGFTIGRVIFSQFGLAYNWPFGAAMAAVLFSTALAGIILAGIAMSRQKV